MVDFPAPAIPMKAVELQPVCKILRVEALERFEALQRSGNQVIGMPILIVQINFSN